MSIDKISSSESAHMLEEVRAFKTLISKDLKKVDSELLQPIEGFDIDVLESADKKVDPEKFKKAEQMYYNLVKEYYRLLEKYGSLGYLDAGDREDRRNLHIYMIKYRNKFEGRWSLQPFNDAYQQMENTFQSWFNYPYSDK